MRRASWIGKVLHRLYREQTNLRRVPSWFPLSFGHVKDLSRLNRDLQRVVFVDSYAPHAALQNDNLLPVSRYVGDEIDPQTNAVLRKDDELKRIGTFLVGMASSLRCVLSVIDFSLFVIVAFGVIRPAQHLSCCRFCSCPN